MERGVVEGLAGQRKRWEHHTARGGFTVSDCVRLKRDTTRPGLDSLCQTQTSGQYY